MGPLMAHHNRQQRLEFPVAIGGATDMDGHAEWANPDENDPKRCSARLKFRTAARP
jgi:hypothetical protein